MKILKSLALIPIIFAMTTVAQAAIRDVTIKVNGQTGQIGPIEVDPHARLTFISFNYLNPSIYKACCSVCSKTGKRATYEAFINANGQLRPMGKHEISGTTPCNETFYISTANGTNNDPYSLDGNGYFGFHNWGTKHGYLVPAETVVAVCTFSKVLPTK